MIYLKCSCGVVAVKYEAHLDDGTLVGKSDGVEFTVKEGKCKLIISWSVIFSLWNVMSYIYVYNVIGHFCPALSKAVKTMKKGEKVILTVKPQCKFTGNDYVTPLFSIKNLASTLDMYAFLNCVTDGFGEKGKPAQGGEVAVPPNATLQITLELVSWKTVSEVTDDKKVIKKIVNEGEGYERPNEGAVVKCKSSLMPMTMTIFFHCF